MNREVTKFQNRYLGGTYNCVICNKPLSGICNVVGEADDEEGFGWIPFCNDCWISARTISPETLYNDYKHLRKDGVYVGCNE